MVNTVQYTDGQLYVFAKKAALQKCACPSENKNLSICSTGHCDIVIVVNAGA
jgi:hypothetical protein